MGGAEGEDAAVRAHQQVPAPTGGANHPHYILDVDVDAGERTVELGITEGEKATVGADEVVAKTIASGGDGHNVQDVFAELGQVAVVLGVTHGADAAVGGHDPVTLGRRGRRNPHDRTCRG